MAATRSSATTSTARRTRPVQTTFAFAAPAPKPKPVGKHYYEPYCTYCGASFPNMAEAASHVEGCRARKRR